jgi:exopolyphosphatase/guanosine-5'-triphosphate,3'-diphosphate pyrophosphatase
VIDCGSHSTRLLLSTRAAELARVSTDTHLGQWQQQRGADASTSSAAIGTLRAVTEYRETIQQHLQQQAGTRFSLGGVVAVATAAVREAADGPQLAASISSALGHPLRVLSGAAAARAPCVCT